MGDTVWTWVGRRLKGLKVYTLGISWIDSIEHHCRHPIYDPITQALHMCLILRHRIRPRCPSLCASRCPPRALAFGYRLEAWSLAITFRLGLWLSPRGLVFGYHLEAWSLAITSRLGLWLSPRALVFGYHLGAWSLAITSSQIWKDLWRNVFISCC